MLTQKRLKELLTYNQETGEFTRNLTTGGQYKNSSAGFKNTEGYIKIKIDGKPYFAHRLAFLYVIGTFPPEETDHINGIRDDNRWVNLRAATKNENLHNQRKAQKSNKSSKLLGASYCPSHKKWKSYIGYNGKVKHLGWFSTKEEAHKVYLETKRELHKFCTI